jgi:hypothetical protein
MKSTSDFYHSCIDLRAKLESFLLVAERLGLSIVVAHLCMAKDSLDQELKDASVDDGSALDLPEPPSTLKN